MRRKKKAKKETEETSGESEWRLLAVATVNNSLTEEDAGGARSTVRSPVPRRAGPVGGIPRGVGPNEEEHAWRAVRNK